MTGARSLTQEEARERAALIDVGRYDLRFDLTGLAEGGALRVISTITFSATTPGATTFIDCLARVEEATLNGSPLATGTPADGRLQLPDLELDNVLVVHSVQDRTDSGQGVHRSVDPSDGEVYVWTSFEPDDARMVFACFDQPDLKAVFGISVLAPERWSVTSNTGAAEITTADGARRWNYADTPPLSTYVPVVNAGPFVELRSTRDGYDLGLYARRSLAPMLERDAEELFDLTAKGLAFFGEQFAMPFPQPRYDQVFVPEFGGAMENYGCVTWSASHPTTARRRRDGRGELRRHHLPQGCGGPQAARHLRRRGHLRHGAEELLQEARLGQHHPRRLDRRDRVSR